MLLFFLGFGTREQNTITLSDQIYVNIVLVFKAKKRQPKIQREESTHTKLKTTRDEMRKKTMITIKYSIDGNESDNQTSSRNKVNAARTHRQPL